MNKSPLITIITPTYMQGIFIEDCIRSIKEQTYQNIEHIVLDAESTDQTKNVIKKYLGTYPLTYIREKDKGQANAINKGLDMAKGDIVCWLNSDDFFFDHQVLERVVALFVGSFPLIDVVMGDSYYVDENGKCIAPISPGKPKYIKYQYMVCADHVIQPSTFWKKNSIRIDENLNYAFDWKYFIDFYKNGLAFLYTRDYFSCYRVHAESKTFTDTHERKKEICQVLKYNKAPVISRAWARLVYFGYWLSAATHLKFIRKLTFTANQAMKKLTGGKIYSC